MYEDLDVLTGEHFISGNVAIAEGCIAAGCRFFAGYPITPSSEIAERMAYRLPQVGGVFLQMEDEIGSINAVIGASWGGVKSMTATSGPGFSLMQEGIGYAAITETPCVIIDVQRGSPGTGLPTLIGQGDVMQSKWGSHGDYEIIALSPESPHEAFNLAIECFNLAERYRVPVVMLTDECVAHMYERVVIPPKNKIKIINRKKPKVPYGEYLPFKPDDDLVPPMACAGDGYDIHVTGLTHDERGYPATNAEAHEKLIRRICMKIKKHADEIIKVEQYLLDDADIAVIAYGAVARSARRAVKIARKNGIKVGLLRFITIWPFPEDLIRQLSSRLKAFVVAEVNSGHVFREVERVSKGKVKLNLISKMGGALHKPEEIIDGIEEVAK